MEALQLEQDLWKEIGRATVDRRHPWRYPTLATQTAEGPEQRTLVLRDYQLDRKMLVFFTDYRSTKVGEIRQYPSASVHLYHPKKQRQARLKVQVIIHHQNETCAEYLARIPKEQRKDYQSISAPGAVFEANGWDEDSAVENFCVLELKVQEVDYLQLRREQGHLRFRYRYDAEGNLTEALQLQA